MIKKLLCYIFGHKDKEYNIHGFKNTKKITCLRCGRSLIRGGGSLGWMYYNISDKEND
jgi:hypothetical protein